MLLYAIQRVALSVLIILTSMVMLFTALKLIPGDLGDDHAGRR